MDSQQELFSALLVQLKKELKSKEVSVYDTFLPCEGTPYPYVYIGSSQLVDDYGNKTMILGNITQVVDVWHNNRRNRGLEHLLSQQHTNETLQKMQIQLLQKMALFVHHQWQKLKSHRHLLCQKVMQSLIN